MQIWELRRSTDRCCATFFGVLLGRVLRAGCKVSGPGIKGKLLSIGYGLATIGRAALQLALTGELQQDRRGG